MSTYSIIINPLSSYMKMLNIILYSCLKYNCHILYLCKHYLYHIYYALCFIDHYIALYYGFYNESILSMCSISSIMFYILY